MHNGMTSFKNYSCSAFSLHELRPWFANLCAAENFTESSYEV